MPKEPTKLPEERLAKLYGRGGFGGETTMRAKVIPEVIDEIGALRAEVAVSPGAGWES